MTVNKSHLFSTLFNNFLERNHDVEAIIVSDADGLVISGEKRKDIDIKIVSYLTAVVNPVLERIRNEFSFQKFGTASFDTEDNRLLIISVDQENVLSLVINNMASIDQISPSAYFLAEKTAQILTLQEDIWIDLKVPNFEYEAERLERMKHQIYQMRLDTGGMYRFKFIIIGDHEVGKTSIVRRYVDDRFSTDYRATIGLNILTHKFDFLGNEINLALWDVGAQKYFKRFRKTYYLGAQAAFIVFDITNRETYDHVNVWFEELSNFIEGRDLPIVIVGNKTDLEGQRQVSYQEGVEKASELVKSGLSKVSYIETSAKSGDNVEDAFNLISYHYIMKSKEQEEDRLRKTLYNEIEDIITSSGDLEIDFVAESPYWNPGLQIISEMKQLGDLKPLVEEKDKKVYQYTNGLKVKSFTYDNFDVSTADGVFCIFDARRRDHIDPKWKEIVLKFIEKIGENKVILLGIRMSEGLSISQLEEEFDINQALEKKMVSLLFFKIGDEYRLEIYDQLEIMLVTIKNLK